MRHFCFKICVPSQLFRNLRKFDFGSLGSVYNGQLTALGLLFKAQGGSLKFWAEAVSSNLGSV